MFWTREEKFVVNVNISVIFPAWKSTVLYCFIFHFYISWALSIGQHKLQTYVHFWLGKNLNHLILWPWWISYFGRSMKIEMPSEYLQQKMHNYHQTNCTRSRTNSTVWLNHDIIQLQGIFFGIFDRFPTLAELLNPSLCLVWEDLAPLGAGGCCKVVHKHRYST